MARRGTLGREHPPSLTRSATDSEKIDSPVAHGYISDPGDGLAVWRGDQPTIPIDVLDSELIQLLFIPNTGIANEDHEVTEKLKRPRPPIAFRGPGQEFPLRSIVQQ